jgi:O-antigen/teichoic acid export membrane protein
VTPVSGARDAELAGGSLPRKQVRGGRTVIGDFLSLAGGQSTALVLAPIAVILTTRLLGPQGFGRFNLLVLVPQLAVGIAGTWTAASVPTLGREELELQGTMGRTTWARAALTVPLIAAVTAALLIVYLTTGLYHGYASSTVVIVLLWTPVLVIYDHIIQLAVAAGRFRLSALGQILERTCLIATLGVLLIVGGSGSISAVVAAYVAAGVLAAVYLGARVGRVGFSPLVVDRPHLRRLLAFSLPMIVATVSAFGVRWCDVVIIKLYGGYGQVGNYALAYQAYTMLFTLATAVISVLTPLMVSLRLAGRDGDIVRYYERVVPQASVLVAGIVGIVAGPAAAALPLVFGHGFTSAGPPLVILLVAMQATVSGFLLQPILFAGERTRLMASAGLLAMVANVGLDFALIPLIGIKGAAIATVIANVLLTARLDLAVARELRRPLRATLVVGPLPAVLGALPVVLMHGPARFVIGPLAAMAALVVLLRWTSLVIPEDVEIIHRLALPEVVRRFATRGIELASGS